MPCNPSTVVLPVLLGGLLFAPITQATSLTWDPSPGPDVAGYELHVGHTSGNYTYSIDVGPYTTVPLPPVSAGRAHYFAVTAYNLAGGRSGFSNELFLSREQGEAIPLSANFEMWPMFGEAPLTTRFSPMATGAILWYEWDFGDGSTYQSDSVTPLTDVVNTYQSPGTYSVTFTVAGPGGMRSSRQDGAIRVTAASRSDACPCTLFGSEYPDFEDDGRDEPISVGMRIKSVRDGFVTAIRFYKSARNAGPHVGALWTEAGQPLATVTFLEETGAGWQQADFANPIPIAAHQVYVVTYHAPHGHVSWDNGAFLKDIVNGPLVAPASRMTAPNGVYAFGPSHTFPHRGDKQARFWVDLVYVPAATPEVMGIEAATSPTAGLPPR